MCGIVFVAMALGDGIAEFLTRSNLLLKHIYLQNTFTIHLPMLLVFENRCTLTLSQRTRFPRRKSLA